MRLQAALRHQDLGLSRMWRGLGRRRIIAQMGLSRDILYPTQRDCEGPCSESVIKLGCRP
jgi:hypothetical protein